MRLFAYLSYESSYPALLFFAAPLIFLSYYLWERERKYTLQQLSACDNRSAHYWCRKAVLLIGALLFIAIAWMGPSWQHKNLTHSAEYIQKPHDILFFLDTSASMAIADLPLAQTRLKGSEVLIADTLSYLAADTVGLYTFAADTNLLSPPTLDHLYLRMLLQAASINDTGSGGTDFTTVFAEIYRKFFPLHPEKDYTIVFFTDGDDTRFTASQEQDSALLSTIKNISPIDLHIVGVGSLEGRDVPDVVFKEKAVNSPLRESFLKSLAEREGGAYYRYEVELGKELASRIQKKNREISIKEEISAQITPLFFLPVGAAIALMIASLCIKESIALYGIALLLTPSLFAERPELFVEAKQYQKALEIYQVMQVPDWQKELVCYNRALVFLKQGRWQEAVELLKKINPTAALANRYYYHFAVALLGYVEAQEALISIEDLSFMSKQKSLSISLDRAAYFLQLSEQKDLESYKLVESRIKCAKSSLICWQKKYTIAQLSSAQKIAKLMVAIEEQMSCFSQAELDLEQMRALAAFWEGLTEKEFSSVGYQKFQRALQAIEKNEKEVARKEFNLALDSLEQQLLHEISCPDAKELHGEEEMISTMRALIKNYYTLLAHRVVSFPAIESLQNSLEKLKSFLELPSMSKMENLTELKKRLQLSIFFHKIGAKAAEERAKVASIFLNQALFWLKSGYQLLQCSNWIIDQSIEKLHHVIFTVVQIMELSDEDSKSFCAEDLQQAMHLAQKEVEQSSYPFIQQVLTAQKEGFFLHCTCQKHPWRDVMPLFFLGENFMKRAGLHLSKAPLSALLSDQKKAYTSWVKASKILHSKTLQKEAESPLSLKNRSIEQTVNLLKQMEQEDRERRSPVVRDGHSW